MDEGRGLTLRFHSRFARELTPGIDGRYFSDEYSGENARVVFRAWDQEWYGSHIYTRVRAVQTAFNAVAQNTLYTRTFDIDAAKPLIAANSSYTYDANLLTDVDARELETVSEALSWTKIAPADAKFEYTDGTAISEGGVSVEPGVPGSIHISDIEDDSTFSYRFKINNRTNRAIRMTSITLYGEGVQRLTDFPVVEENTDAVRAHNINRTLELGQTYAGAEYNGETIASSSVCLLYTSPSPRDS